MCQPWEISNRMQCVSCFISNLNFHFRCLIMKCLLCMSLLFQIDFCVVSTENSCFFRISIIYYFIYLFEHTRILQQRNYKTHTEIQRKRNSESVKNEHR